MTDKDLAILVRRALLMVASGIARKFGLEMNEQERIAARD